MNMSGSVYFAKHVKMVHVWSYDFADFVVVIKQKVPGSIPWLVSQWLIFMLFDVIRTYLLNTAKSEILHSFKGQQLETKQETHKSNLI